MALRFLEGPGRWEIRLADGEGKQIRPANLEAVDGGSGRVFAFWGDARWSRTQLLGEIARGHWGLCKASTSELTAPVGDRWKGLDGRMVFAPQTAMTDDFMRDGAHEMTAVRNMALVHGFGEDGDSGDENQ